MTLPSCRSSLPRTSRVDFMPAARSRSGKQLLWRSSTAWSSASTQAMPTSSILAGGVALEPAQVYVDCIYQIGALLAVATVEQTAVKFVKPHGGLYHQANREAIYADAVIEAAKTFNLIVMGLARFAIGSALAGSLCFRGRGFRRSPLSAGWQSGAAR